MDYYDEIADSYNELYGKEQQAKYEFISKLVEIKGNVLDVGCGDCQLAKHFKVKYYGVEPASKLVTKSKHADFFDIRNIQLCTAEDMVLNNKFDVVLCITVAHHFTNPLLVFSKIKKSLKPQGKVVVSILKNSQKRKELHILLTELFQVETHNQGKDIVFLCSSKL